jgi:hypothetical protein
MAVAYVSIGSIGIGSTSVTAGTPASLATGDGVLIHVMTKPDTATISTPAGWTLISDVAGGGGTSGNGTGPTRQATFFREKDAGWTTVPAVTVTNGNSTAAVASRWTKAAGTTWDVAGATGVYGTAAATTNASTVLGSNPGITSGDMLAVGFSNQDDLPTWSAQTISATGATFGSITERSDVIETTTGNDMGGMLFTAACTAGTASSAATVGGTLSAAGRGTAALTRLREVASSGTINATPTGIASSEAFGSVTMQGGATGPAALREYAFNEGSGTTAAEVNGGTSITGITAWNATGKNGAALQVTGTGPTVAPYSGAGPFTIMAWFYVTSNANWQSLLESSWLQYLEVNGLALDWYDGGMAISGGTLANNTWNHIAITASGTVNTLYVNGTSVGTNNRNTPSGTGAINIGGSSSQGGNATRVDDLRFYSTALTQAQIQQLMNTPVAPTGPPPAINAAPSGIASAEAFGNPVNTGNPNDLAPTGIASAASFGTPTVNHVYDFPFVAAASANGRRLVDHSGNPVINVFDTLWSVIQIAGRDNAGNWQGDMDLWVNTRSAQGFTGLKFCLFAQTINGAPADLLTFDDVSPFNTSSPTTADIGSLNNTYWQRVDYLVDKAAAAGMTCWIHIMYKDDVSAPSGTGWLQSQTSTEYTNFGTALATRYKSSPNIVWVYGGDYFDESASSMQLIDTAMKAAGDTHLVTVQNYSDSSGGTFWTTSRQEGPTVSNLTLGNAIATVDGIYIYQNLHLGAKQAWQDTPTLPSVYYDGYYDQNSGAAATRMRRDWGWALTSGVNASHYGSESTWSMGASWRSNLTNTQGVQHVISLRNSFTGLARWSELVPDFATDFITSSRGTGTSYITGAKTSDGELAVVYMPSATTTSVTVNNSVLTPSYTAKWVDPTNGASTSTSTGSTYTKTGTNAAGGTDWLLVLEKTAASLITASPDGIGTGESFGTATGQLAGGGSLSLSGAGTLATAGVPRPVQSTSFSGAGTLSLAAVPRPAQSLSLSGSGTITTTSIPRPAQTLPLSGVGTLSTDAVASPVQTLGLSGAGTFTASVQISTSGAVSLSGAGTLIATAQVATSSTLSLFGTGTLTTLAVPRPEQTLLLTGSGTLASSAQIATSSAVSMSGAGTLSVSAAAGPIQALSLSGTGTLVPSVQVAASSAASLSGTGTLTTQVVPRPTQTLPLSGAGALSVASVANPQQTAGLSGAGTLTTIAQAAASGTLSLSGAGTLALASVSSPTQTLGLSGSGTLSASVSPNPARTLGFTGSGALSTSSVVTTSGSLALAGLGTMSPFGVTAYSATLGLSGSGSLTFSGSTLNVTRALGFSGAGTLAFTSKPAVSRSIGLLGSGTLTSGGVAGFAAGPALNGTGTLDAVSSVQASGQVTLSGSGSFTGFGGGSGGGLLALSGSGSLLSAGSSISVSSNLSFNGAGSLAAISVPKFAAILGLSGSGTLSAAIVPRPVAAVSFTGSGQLATSTSVGASGLLSTSGSGTLGATSSSGSAGVLSLSGSGTLGAAPDNVFVFQTFTLAGSGSLGLGAAPRASGTLELGGSGSLAALEEMANIFSTLYTSGDGSLAITPVIPVEYTLGFTGSGFLDVDPPREDVDITVFVGVTRKPTIAGGLVITPGRVSTLAVGASRIGTVVVGASHDAGLDVLLASSRTSEDVIGPTRANSAEIETTRRGSVIVGDNRRKLEVGPTRRDRME